MKKQLEQVIKEAKEKWGEDEFTIRWNTSIYTDKQPEECHIRWRYNLGKLIDKYV